MKIPPRRENEKHYPSYWQEGMKITLYQRFVYPLQILHVRVLPFIEIKSKDL